MLTSVRRGLLLVYDAMVFGDTSESVDEVISPRFLFLSFSTRDLWTEIIHGTQVSHLRLPQAFTRSCCDCRG